MVADQLALNLSRYGTQTGCRGWGRAGLQGIFSGAAVVPVGKAGQKLGPRLADRARKGTLGGGGS